MSEKSDRPFDEELNALKDRLLYMGGLAQEMIGLAVQAIATRNADLTQQVFEIEKQVNRLHVEIDDTIIKLIARHQPMAVDLRFLAAAMKINSEVERTADYAVNASQTYYYHLFKERPVSQISLVRRLAENAERMLREALESFKNRDVALARSVLLQEAAQDKLKAFAVTQLIDLIRMDSEKSQQFVDLILLSKNMERIADHATNIAEDVIFMVLGKDIRHQSIPIESLSA